MSHHFDRSRDTPFGAGLLDHGSGTDERFIGALAMGRHGLLFYVVLYVLLIFKLCIKFELSLYELLRNKWFVVNMLGLGF